MAFRFDHAIILVYDLEKASAAYREAGFTVVYGGQHAGGKTHNALIVFRDGAYLELMAPTDLALLQSIDPEDRSNYLFLFQQDEGYGGYALQSDNLETDTDTLRARGLTIELHPPGGRARPDGQQLRWQIAALPETMTPFFMQDITPRSLRVPDDASTTTHPNGALGVARLTLHESPLQRTLYTIIMDSNQGANESVFQPGCVEIRLLNDAPGEANRLHEIVLRTDEAGTRTITASKGAKIQLVGKR